MTVLARGQEPSFLRTALRGSLLDNRSSRAESALSHFLIASKLTDISSFRSESSYQFFCVFVCPSLPCTVWIGVKHLCSFTALYRFLHALMIEVLTAVIVEHLSKSVSTKPTFRSAHYGYCCILRFVFKLIYPLI